MKLWSFFGSPRTNKIIAAAQFAEVSVSLVPLTHDDFPKIKEKEFLVKNPNGKVPVLEI